MAAWRSVIQSPGTITVPLFSGRNPVRMIDGRAEGYTGRYEVSCPPCGDDPSLSYDQLPPSLQKIRGPSESLAGGLPAFHAHVRLAGAAPMSEAMTQSGACCHRRVVAGVDGTASRPP